MRVGLVALAAAALCACGATSSPSPTPASAASIACAAGGNLASIIAAGSDRTETNEQLAQALDADQAAWNRASLLALRAGDAHSTAFATVAADAGRVKVDLTDGGPFDADLAQLRSDWQSALVGVPC